MLVVGIVRTLYIVNVCLETCSEIFAMTRRRGCHTDRRRLELAYFLLCGMSLSLDDLIPCESGTDRYALCISMGRACGGVLLSGLDRRQGH